jgi:hypothetical protein
MVKIQSYIVILIVLVIGTIFFRYSYHNENKIYQNYDATYHALLTIKALNETSITQHHLLPIVSLGEERDKNIPWGATIPDKYGNYYYTSFPIGGFVFPYLIFKIFNLDISVNSLFIVSSFILLITILLVFLLTKNISSYLNPLSNSNTPAFLVAILYMFSIETLYSHGYVYWGHSLMQPIFILFLHLMFKIFTKQENAYYTILIVLLSFFLGWTEWSGYLIVFGAMVALLFSDLNKKKKYLYIGTCALGGVLALSFFILDFMMTVDTATFFQALQSRFFARNITTDIPISLLFNKYWESYNILLIILPLSIFVLIFGKNTIQEEKKRTLLLLLIIVLFGLLENIIMKQHAIAYHFDRLKFLSLFLIAVPFLWFYKNKTFQTVIVLIIVVSSLYSVSLYSKLRITENTALTDNQLFVQSDVFKQECDSCLLGIRESVRGYTNLLFNRGVYEWITYASLKNIAYQKNTCACYINVKGIGGV